MLKTLHIENVAVIEKVTVELGEGLNVLTGETGAGKSIVIDALGAVLGGRTSRELVRSGEPSALVTAVFSAENVSDWCEDAGIEPEDGELFLMRKITADGKNTCRVNGIPVSVSQLRALGLRLLDIHGQNDGQKLLDERYHRQYLDSYGRPEAEYLAYRAEYDKYCAIKKEIDSLRIDERDKEFRIDTLKYQINEIKKANIKVGERDEKTKRRQILANAEKLSGLADTAFFAIYGADCSDGVLSMLQDAERAVSSAGRYSEDFAALEKELSDLRYTAEDIAERIRDLRDDLDYSAEELDDIESRLSLLRKLSVKYGSTEEEILTYLENAETELDNIEYADDKIAKLEKDLKKQTEITRSAAEKLSYARKRAAETLEKRIANELSGLSMPKVLFRVVLDATEDFTPTGCDEVRFEMSANAGEKPGRISRIASGGELSRIMLAMKNVLAENDDIGTMVFDEIDTGVSGIAAQRVGEKLATLAGKKQVICVTHLPQIAAMADEHYEIKKNERGGRAFTGITRLDSRTRLNEIARLTGGDNVTETTLRSASEQVAAADAFKTAVREK